MNANITEGTSISLKLVVVLIAAAIAVGGYIFRLEAMAEDVRSHEEVLDELEKGQTRSLTIQEGQQDISEDHDERLDALQDIVDRQQLIIDWLLKPGEVNDGEGRP